MSQTTEPQPTPFGIPLSEPPEPGRVSQPSANFNHYLKTGEGLERATNPPMHEPHDTERPPAIVSTLPSPPPDDEPEVEIGEVESLPASQIRAALERFEATAEHMKDLATHLFEQVQQVRQVIALLPCMKDGEPPVKCLLQAAAE